MREVVHVYKGVEVRIFGWEKVPITLPDADTDEPVEFVPADEDSDENRPSLTPKEQAEYWEGFVA